VSRGEVEERVRRRYLAEPGRGTPEHRLAVLLRAEDPLLPDDAVTSRARRLAGELVGLGPLQQLLDDPEVTDVLANGPGPVWVERCGRLRRTSVVVDAEQITRAVERLVAPLGLRADRAHPVIDARLADGSRVAAVLSPLAVDGPVLAVRRHLRRPLPLEDFAPPPVVALLRALVDERRNLVVYGPTGAGKTTVVNALAAGLPPHERVVTIEDVAELQLPGDHVVRLEARPGTSDGVGRVGMRDLVRAALRLRPDRIIVGEVRGAEAAEMVWALSTGHRGGFSTCHAGSASDALARLETMCLLGHGNVAPLAVRAQVWSAVDVLVGVDRADDGRRRVVGVHAVGPQGLGADLLSGVLR
jgi:pilus assembly protein CpaF